MSSDEDASTVAQLGNSRVIEPVVMELNDNISHDDFYVFGHMSVDKVLDAVGDSGTYQKSIVMTSILVLFGSAFVSFSVSFLVSEPGFQCELKDRPGNWVECSEDIACSDSSSRAVPAFYSWTQTYGLTCANRVLRESGKSLCLVVNGLTCFLTLNLADVFGRRFMVLFNSILLMTSLCIAYFSNSFYVKMFFVGVAFGSQGAFTSLFVFLINEVSRTLG